MIRIQNPEDVVSQSASDVNVKICGLRNAEDIVTAVEAGATYIGFVFFEKSPRNVSIDVARALAIEVPVGVAKVALTVNASDSFLDELTDKVPLDMLQLHGRETPERVTEIRARYGLPVIKAVGVATRDDLEQLAAYEAVADLILVDAKPSPGAVLPGGNGISFDWRLLAGRRWVKPWMLAGGLSAENVAEAIKLTGARQVDVSSGVESSPGIKDQGMIADFVQAAQKEHYHE
ncbi:phosphoribosylanthranilate isomerase [Falsihalocynthiibacter arcticus]|uniref:N-(5'-phosphoribosyl)anthranilate isomerase n=1 Tax=Falsihalocynthiibacter arcticus TaxID=1579316 RepID=A0A126UY21_9RHOB|nr:phosphoribosylanthranilate isomerase [Falsihalocynthiibacter arcticus]AML50329.1 N-(5'-phosphoribosyl)anthranilate isomerase [Falsihalocynthiibacter arcticus]